MVTTICLVLLGYAIFSASKYLAAFSGVIFFIMGILLAVEPVLIYNATNTTTTLNLNTSLELVTGTTTSATVYGYKAINSNLNEILQWGFMMLGFGLPAFAVAAHYNQKKEDDED